MRSRRSREPSSRNPKRFSARTTDTIRVSDDIMICICRELAPPTLEGLTDVLADVLQRSRLLLLLRELLAEPSVFNNKFVNLLNRGFLGPERLLRLLGHLPGELDLLDVDFWEGVLARLGRGSRG